MSPRGASVHVEAEMIGTRLLLVVSGEADLYSAPELRDALGAALARGPRSVTLEVSQLTYCDLAGLDALNDFCAHASLAGVRTVVHGMSSRLAWLHATFPAPEGMPASADHPADVTTSPPRRERRGPDAALPGTASTAAVALPRPWPER